MTAPLLVADAGPLIALAIAELLPLTVAHYGTLLVPQAVLDECTAAASAPGANTILGLLPRLQIIPHADIAQLDAAYARGLGSGELAVLAYAAQHAHIALVDDRKAVAIAERLGVKNTRTGAVLLALKAAGKINSIRPALAAWQAHGYFLAPAVVLSLLAFAGES